jgi:hypothetical protein
MTAKIQVNTSPEADKPAKPGKDTIYIDVDDDITTIIDKVEAAKQKVVALVLPKRASALQSVVNMRLLKRSAENSSKNIVLITAESSLLPLAGAAGLHVAKNLQSKPEVPPPPGGLEPDSPEPPVPDGADEDDIDDKSAKLDYHRSIGELAAVHAVDEIITLDEPDADGDELPKPKVTKSDAPKQVKNQKIKVPNFERFRLLMLAGIIGLVALIVFIILALFVLPKSTVTVTTSAIPVSESVTYDASDKYTKLNEEAKQIPVTLKATKQTSSQQVQATGQQNNGDKAQGSVTMSAGTCSATFPSDVPAGTGVSTGGLTFITQSTASFTAKNSGGKCVFQSGSIPIKAQAGGAKYNVSSATFSVAGYSNVTATGSASGGTDDNQTVVSQQDLDNARQKITSASSDDFTKKFEQQLSDQGYYVLASTLKLGDPEVTATPNVGQAASTVNVNITITYTVLAVQKTDLRKVITDSLSSQIDKTKQKLSTADPLKGATVTVKNQTGPAVAQLEINDDTTAVPIISASQIQKIAIGRKSGDIKAAISGWPGVKSVDVKMSPFWVSKAPKNTSKITVKLVQVKE